MCRLKSGIILKNRVVLAPEGNDSHSDLLETLGIDDNHLNATKTFVREELTPPDGNKATEIGKLNYVVDQVITLDWYDKDTVTYEVDLRAVVKQYLRDKFIVMCGHAWTPIKKDEKCTYYLLNGFLETSAFGKNNNFAESDIITKLREHKLVEDLRKQFGDRLVPITTDLTSIDGLKDYGMISGDILSLPTIGTIMEFGESIPPIGRSYWTPTPNQTPSRGDASGVRGVRSVGDVGCDDCRWGVWGVRPFFILQS